MVAFFATFRLEFFHVVPINWKGLDRPALFRVPPGVPRACVALSSRRGCPLTSFISFMYHFSERVPF